MTTTTQDLFEDYENQPKELQIICDKWQEKQANEGLSYSDCKAFLEECNAIGYTFEYELDAEPFGLMKISDKEKDFENWKLLFHFLHSNEHIKGWINYENFTDHYMDDWNPLMEVVSKIETIGASVIIGRFFCEIKYTNPLNEAMHFDNRIACGIKIKAVHGAVLNFIKWYNEQ